MKKNYQFLNNINFPSDLRKVSENNLQKVADEVREEMISAVSETGGHLGAGLGVVELTVALHYVFDTPNDKLIWDVGHQSYPHKILTGRKDKIRTLRQGDGLSGFTKRSESEYDPFGAAHSSTSISSALGIAEGSSLPRPRWLGLTFGTSGCACAGRRAPMGSCPMTGRPVRSSCCWTGGPGRSSCRSRRGGCNAITASVRRAKAMTTPSTPTRFWPSTVQVCAPMRPPICVRLRSGGTGRSAGYVGPGSTETAGRARRCRGARTAKPICCASAIHPVSGERPN